MRINRILITTALAVLPLAALVPAGHAAVPTCNGLEATIVGTDGPDHLVGTDGPDVAVLGGGNDIFSGGKGDDVICGGDGKDTLYGGTGNDTVFGEAGRDVVREGPGDDHLDGGSDVDRLLYVSSGAQGLRLDARIGKATSSNGTDLFTGFESYVGTTGSDTLIGSSRSEKFDTLTGEHEVVYGFGGDDRITNTSHSNALIEVDAGDGNDDVHVYAATAQVRLGAGDDKFSQYFPKPTGGWYDGGSGTDAIALIGYNHRFEINLNQKFLLPIGSGIKMPLNHFENVSGGWNSDRIVGDAGVNYLYGGSGDDVVLGLGGDDHLVAGNWDDYDVADGGAGTDACYGFDRRTNC